MSSAWWCWRSFARSRLPPPRLRSWAPLRRHALAHRRALVARYGTIFPPHRQLPLNNRYRIELHPALLFCSAPISLVGKERWVERLRPRSPRFDARAHARYATGAPLSDRSEIFEPVPSAREGLASNDPGGGTPGPKATGHRGKGGREDTGRPATIAKVYGPSPWQTVPGLLPRNGMWRGTQNPSHLRLTRT